MRRTVNFLENCSVIIPAFNEERRIEGAVGPFLSVPQVCEVIVICDGKDKTSELLLRKGWRKVKVVAYPSRLGKGKAVIEGFRMACGDFVAFADADESVGEGEFSRLLSVLQKEQLAGAIIGSRYAPGAKASIGFFRRIPSRIFNTMVEFLFHLGIKDTQCGLKILRRNALEAVLPQLSVRGWVFDVELLLALRENGFPIIEAPIVWKNSSGSRMGAFAPLSMLYSLAGLWLRSRSGRLTSKLERIKN